MVRPRIPTFGPPAPTPQASRHRAENTRLWRPSVGFGQYTHVLGPLRAPLFLLITSLTNTTDTTPVHTPILPWIQTSRTLPQPTWTALHPTIPPKITPALASKPKPEPDTRHPTPDTPPFPPVTKTLKPSSPSLQLHHPFILHFLFLRRALWRRTLRGHHTL